VQIPTWVLLGISIGLWGLWGFAEKLALKGLAPYQVQVVMAVCSAMLIPLYMYLARGASAALWPLTIYSGYCVLATLAGAGAGVCFLYALGRGSAGAVVAITAVYPIVTALLSFVFLGDVPELTFWLGVILTVSGVALIAH